jgi:transposase InsO family protein
VAQKVVSMQAKLAAVLAREAAEGPVLPVAVLCRSLGISRQTYYKYRRRFEVDGIDGLVERSRRPHHSPTRLDAAGEELIVAARKALEGDGWDNGAISIHARLERDHCPGVASLRTIHRVLLRRGLVEPAPQKRPRSSCRRFEYPATNDCWQLDAFEHVLVGGTKVVVFEVLDDHSRFLTSTLAWPSEDGAGAWIAVSAAIANYGRPRMLLSDNSLAFSGARRHREVQFEKNLRAAGIKPITARPYKPTTCGKNERHHQTSQRWLRHHHSAATLAELQTQLHTYQHAYNHDRPHQGIAMHTPDQRRQHGLRTNHNDLTDPDIATTITEHTVNARGQVRITGTAIGLGSQWTGSRVTAFTTGDHIALFHLDHLVRELTIDRTRRFQPTGQPRGGNRRTRISDTVG